MKIIKSFYLKSIVLAIGFWLMVCSKSFGQFSVSCNLDGEPYNENYITLQSLIDNVFLMPADEMTITMTSDYTVSENENIPNSIPGAGSMTFDLGGHTLNLVNKSLNFENFYVTFRNGTITSSVVPVISINSGYFLELGEGITVSTSNNTGGDIITGIVTFDYTKCEVVDENQNIIPTTLYNDQIDYSNKKSITVRQGAFKVEATSEATSEERTYYASCLRSALDFGNNSFSKVKITQQRNNSPQYNWFVNSENHPISVSGVEVEVNLLSLIDTLTIDVKGGAKLTIHAGASSQLYSQFNVTDNSSLTLDGGQYTYFENIVEVARGSSAQLTDVTIVTNKSSEYGMNKTKTSDAFVINNGTLEINGGNYSYLEESSTDNSVGYGIYSKGTTLINGGVFKGKIIAAAGTTGDQQFYPLYVESGTTTITGGTFSGAQYGLDYKGGIVELSCADGATVEFSGDAAAIYNFPLDAMLKDGYAFYNGVNMLYYDTEEKYEVYTDNGFLKLPTGQTEEYKTLTVKKAQPAYPKTITVGPNALVYFEIKGLDNTVTFKKLDKVQISYDEQAKKYLLKTNNDVADGDYVIESNDGTISITVKVKDCTKGLYDSDKWYRTTFRFGHVVYSDGDSPVFYINSIDSHNDCPFGEGIKLNVTSTTATVTAGENNSATNQSFSIFKTSTAEGNHTIVVEFTDDKGNVWSQTNLTLKLDFTAPVVPYITYQEGTETKKVEVGSSTTPTEVFIDKDTKITLVTSEPEGKTTLSTPLYVGYFVPSTNVVADTTWVETGTEIELSNFGIIGFRAKDNIEVNNGGANASDIGYINFKGFYTVTFENDKGTAPDPQKVKEGDKLTEPETPTAEGYQFAGWYVKGQTNIEWTFNDSPVTQDLTLFAKWKRIVPKEAIESVIELEKEYDGGIYVLAKVGGNKIEDSGRNFSYTFADDNTQTLSFVFSAVEYETKNVGENVEITAYPIITAGSDDFVFVENDGYKFNGKITKKTLTNPVLSTNANIEKKYDGTTALVDPTSLTVTSFDGIVGTDKVTVSVDLDNSTYDTKNVGTNKDVRLNFTLTGENAGNYQIEPMTKNIGIITPKEIDLTNFNLTQYVETEKNYDETSTATIKNSSVVVEGVEVAGVKEQVTITIESADFMNSDFMTTSEPGNNYRLSLKLSLPNNGNYYFNPNDGYQYTWEEVESVGKIKAKITFENNGHSTAPTPQYVAVDDKIDEPVLTSNDGFKVISWNTETGSPWNFEEDVVSGNMTLTAHWAKEITPEEIASLIHLTKEYNGGIWATADDDNGGVRQLYNDGSDVVIMYNGIRLLFQSLSYNDAEVAKNKTITAKADITNYTDEVGNTYALPSNEFVVSTKGEITRVEVAEVLGKNASFLLSIDGVFTSDNNDVWVEKSGNDNLLRTSDNVKTGDKATLISSIYKIEVSIICPTQNFATATSWVNTDYKLPAPNLSGYDGDLTVLVDNREVTDFENEIISEEGESKVNYTIKDNSGNILADENIIVKIDKTSPITLASAVSTEKQYEIILEEQSPRRYFLRKGAGISFEVSDLLSGVKGAEFSWDNQDNFKSFDLQDILLLEGGEHILYVRVGDNAENYSLYRIDFFIFDDSKFAGNDSDTATSSPVYYGSKNITAQNFEINLGENTIFAVKDNVGNVFYGTNGDVTFVGNVITVSANYLETLKPEENNYLTVYLNPFGENVWNSDFTSLDYEAQKLVIDLNVVYKVKVADGYRFVSLKDESLKSFCGGDDVAFTLYLDENYSVADNISITQLGVNDVPFSNTIEMIIPLEALRGGNEPIELTFSKDGFLSHDSVVFPGNYPSEYNIKVYDDVLAIDNSKNLFQDGGYQWYIDLKPIEGAHSQFLDILKYLTSDNQTHSFYVSVVDKDGNNFRVCPGDDFVITGLSKSKAVSVNVYPNPAESSKEFSIELNEFDLEDLSNSEILIYNQLGTIVKRISNVEKINYLSLNEGFYNGVVIVSGNKVLNFKIIVK